MCNMAPGCTILPPILSLQPLLGCFGRCAASSFPPLLLIVLWSVCPEDTTHLQFLTQLLVPCAAKSHLAQILACTCWAEAGPVLAPLLERSEESVPTFPLINAHALWTALWQRVGATAWDGRGWVSPLEVGERCFSTPAKVPYKDNISYYSLGISILYLPFLQPLYLFGFNIWLLVQAEKPIIFICWSNKLVFNMMPLC